MYTLSQKYLINQPSPVREVPVTKRQEFTQTFVIFDRLAAVIIFNWAIKFKCQMIFQDI